MPAQPDPEITRRYVEDGETINAIAAGIGRSYGYVHARLVAAKVQMRRQGGGWTAGCRSRWADLAPCGTIAAARRHHRRKEPVDDACREAAAAYLRAYRQRRKETQDADAR